MLELLKGMKVIEIAGFMAAPTAGRILGEWGAEVIKIEGLHGCSTRGVGMARHILNGDTAGFDAINACKKYVALDTRKPEGLEVLKNMIKDADVLISHLRDRDAKKLGLDYDTLKATNSKLICASTSGYGNDGPWGGRGGFDGVAYAARTGFVMDTPVEGSEPMLAYFGYGDVPMGTYLAMSIMAAYINQQRTGKGEQVTCALMHAGMWTANFPIVSSTYGDKYPPNVNEQLPIAKPYRCKDGKYIALMGLQWDTSWPQFVHATGLPEEYIAKWPDYLTGLKNATEITNIIKELLLTQDRQYWVDRLWDTSMPFDLCQHFSELQSDTQAWEGGFFQGIDYPSGMRVGIPKAPALFTEAGVAEFGPSGRVGEDTRAVLKEYGYTDAQVDEMRAAKIVAEGDQWDVDTYNMMKPR